MQIFYEQRRFEGGFATPRARTDYIVVHHAAALYSSRDGLADVQAVADYHIKVRGWPGIGYHVALAEQWQDGPIAAYVLSDLNLQRAHVLNRNHQAIGICALTNLETMPRGEPTQNGLTRLFSA